MSPRIRRQVLRKAAGYAPKPYIDKSRKRKKSTFRRPASSPSAPWLPGTSTPSVVVEPPGNLGMPSRSQYQYIETEYIASLHSRKQEKALLTQELFDKIWDVLHEPSTSRIGTPQFRWWVRKMFVLSDPRASPSPVELESVGEERTMPVVLHENRPVALKDQIYDVLCYCHQLSNHGGRDKTTAVIREHYSWIPKELIAQFVKACPTCIFKKTGKIDLALTMSVKEENTSENVGINEERFIDPDRELPPLIRIGPPVTPECISLPMSNLIPRESVGSDPFLKPWTYSLGSLRSSATPHPMPALQPWLDSYDSQATCWSSRASSGPSTLVHDVLSQSGSLPKNYMLAPLIERLGSADDTYRHAGLRPKGHGITLPPLMKVLSEGAAGLDMPFMPPRLKIPDSFSRSSGASEIVYQDWSRESRDEHLSAAQPSHPVAAGKEEYFPQIDPILMQSEVSNAHWTKGDHHAHCEEQYMSNTNLPGNMHLNTSLTSSANDSFVSRDTIGLGTSTRPRSGRKITALTEPPSSPSPSPSSIDTPGLLPSLTGYRPVVKGVLDGQKLNHPSKGNPGDTRHPELLQADAMHSSSSTPY
ncbi:hypothetical protein AcW1_002057 [Taiwanofungus camphoratus]|nr:hypothetical protein AcW1_002057 [Antrodia cinnamomea]KAI0945958.1 hypothetical protein AcV7_010063 [Antrodia cinnamomea]